MKTEHLRGALLPAGAKLWHFFFPSLEFISTSTPPQAAQVLTPPISPKDQLLHPIYQAAAAGQGAELMWPEGGRGRQPEQGDSLSQEGSHTTTKPQNTSVQFDDNVPSEAQVIRDLRFLLANVISLWNYQVRKAATAIYL